MKITSFRIKNYKSFLDSEEIKFSSGFNIIIGQNNVGKTALLETIGLKFQWKPHKSILSLPNPTIKPTGESNAEITLSLTGEELRDILTNVDRFYLPYPQVSSNIHNYLNEILNSKEIFLTLNFKAAQATQANWDVRNWPIITLPYKCVGSVNNPLFIEINKSQGYSFGDRTSGSIYNDLGITIANIFRERIYIFKAERLNVGSCRFGYNSNLKPDASNLPEVLNKLQSNTVRFNRFNQLVRLIFPSIYQITVRPTPSEQLEIIVWTEEPNKERDDLAIELSEGGTGVGQVLAILYVAITSESARTIIIDEPNSFLHPGAARKLIEILSTQFPHHQYIVSTHSSEIIKAANPSTLTLIRWVKPQSSLKQLNIKQINDVQKCLIEVGTKPSDVFGADNILWVEGPTEEACFPEILQRVGKLPTLGTSIVGVKNTGDLKGKNKKVILDIYKKVSQGNVLLPKAIAFIFDREDMSKKEIEDIKRESKGLVHFLPRRTYENYLIDPSALSVVMTNLETFKDGAITEDQIQKWIIEKGWATEVKNIFERAWLEKVDGAKLLSDLFIDLSEAKERYRKTVHSFELTDWLIENKPEAFKELNDFLLNILRPS